MALGGGVGGGVVVAVASVSQVSGVSQEEVSLRGRGRGCGGCLLLSSPSTSLSPPPSVGGLTSPLNLCCLEGLAGGMQPSV